MKLIKMRSTVPVLALTVMLAAVLVPVTDVAGTAGSSGTPLPVTVPPRVLHVRALVALPDGKTESGNAIRAAMQAALKAGPGSEVALEAGTYLVTPRASREACFPISGAANLVVRGEGKATKIVITDPAAGGFSVGFGRQVTLRDNTASDLDRGTTGLVEDERLEEESYLKQLTLPSSWTTTTWP